jgi:hypothetical protein
MYAQSQYISPINVNLPYALHTCAVFDNSYFREEVW